MYVAVGLARRPHPSSVGRGRRPPSSADGLGRRHCRSTSPDGIARRHGSTASPDGIARRHRSTASLDGIARRHCRSTSCAHAYVYTRGHVHVHTHACTCVQLFRCKQRNGEHTAWWPLLPLDGPHAQPRSQHSSWQDHECCTNTRHAKKAFIHARALHLRKESFRTAPAMRRLSHRHVVYAQASAVAGRIQNPTMTAPQSLPPLWPSVAAQPQDLRACLG